MEWHDLSTRDDYQEFDTSTPKENPFGDTHAYYNEDKPATTPHQGWKIRVTAYPNEARAVAEEVLPYLQENALITR